MTQKRKRAVTPRDLSRLHKKTNKKKKFESEVDAKRRRSTIHMKREKNNSYWLNGEKRRRRMMTDMILTNLQ